MNRTILVLLLVFLGLTAWAEGYGVIVYATGRDVTIQRGEERRSYDAGFGDALGIAVLPGDTIETDNETFLEIQLVATRSIIKVAENTIFKIDGMSSEGTTSLTVAYGRIRARVDRLVGGQDFRIRGLSSVAGVRGTDFGFDQVIIGADSTMSNLIYCFEGEVEVGPSEPTDDVVEPVVIGGGQMVVVSKAVPAVPVPEAMSAGVEGFWGRYDFVEDVVEEGELLQKFPSLAPVAGAAVEPETVVAPTVEIESTTPVVPDGTEVAAEEPTGGNGASTVAVEAVRPDAEAGTGEIDAADVVDPDRRARWSKGFKTTGVVLGVSGIVAEGAAVALFYFGDELMGWWSGYSPSYLGPVAIAGGGLIAAGIISLVVGLVMTP